ncbi:MAG: methanogenesis multiheme c-type cytochrome, partial [Candidatus Methanoperedens sp.]|nr:methanogenesis multiheme c-type cytochrome [Candidatus Methanoperedens sp.]
CGRCHSEDELIFKKHDADGIIGGSISTNCQTCHSGDTSTENLYFTHIADTTCANKCHQTDVATRAVMWSSDNYSSYDVHSNAGIGCIQCHITSNHQIGRGNIIDRSDSSVAADQLVRQCIDCHTEVTHGMIVDAHLEKVSCEACHIPLLPGGMLPGGEPVYSIDWTKGHRDITFKEMDFQPVLAWFNGTVQGIPYPSKRDDPGAVLKPFNVISITWWDEGNDMDIVNSPDSSLRWGSPIVLSHISAADTNRDGEISIGEMRLFDSDIYGKPDYHNAVLRNRQFYYSVSHNIVSKKSALGKSALWCADCHGNTSRIDWALLGYEADPAQTDPPTDFTSYKITVETIPARPEPVEKLFRGGD